MPDVNAVVDGIKQTNSRPRALAVELAALYNASVAKINMLLLLFADMVLPNQTAAGLSVDANAQDFETDNAVWVRKGGQTFSLAAVAAFDWSVSGASAGDTVAISTSGAFWVFGKTAGGLDVETAAGNQAHASEIIALAQYAKATNPLPPVPASQLPIGVIIVTEGGSGAWTAGTDSISGETGTFVDFLGRPGVESAMASFALDAGAATFTYGAAVARLGDATRVSFTGKTAVTLAGSTIATGLTGAWLFYGRADDVEYALQLDNDYASLVAAKEGVRNHNPNPYLALLGAIYIENNSGATFTPGTTLLDASGITCTFVKYGPGADGYEYGRSQLGVPVVALDQILDVNTGLAIE